MNDGTSSIRIRVASISTASVSPTPNIRMNDTSDAAIPANTMLISSAAAVMTRPVLAIPSATALSFAARDLSDASHDSRIRPSRNTS